MGYCLGFRYWEHSSIWPVTERALGVSGMELKVLRNFSGNLMLFRGLQIALCPRLECWLAGPSGLFACEHKGVASAIRSGYRLQRHSAIDNAVYASMITKSAFYFVYKTGWGL
jgi:hypothetical protein